MSLNDVAEPGEVVLAAHRHALVELAGRQALGATAPRAAPGATTCRVTTQAIAPTSSDQDDPGDAAKRPLHQIHRRASRSSGKMKYSS